MKQFQNLSVDIGHGQSFPPWRQGYVLAQADYSIRCKMIGEKIFIYFRLTTTRSML